jgi:type IV secretion system protein VirD4
LQDDFYDKNIILKYCAIVMICSYIIGTWIVTQMVAADCQYNELLGMNISFAGHHIYEPFAYQFWKHDAGIAQAIPYILSAHVIWQWATLFIGFGICYIIDKHFKVLSSHGTANFGKAADIKAAGLDADESGVAIGRNPFTNKLMLHNGEEHVFLGAPTGSGKGVGLIITTGITWKNSVFFFDPKGELWSCTAWYRKNVLKQKVIKFEPLCKDNSTAKWNPYSEIDFQSFDEMSDIITINTTMIKTGEDTKKDPFWDDAPIALLNGVVLHLLYKHYQEQRNLPCPTDAMSFISSPNMDTDHLFTTMKLYPHISPQEFMQIEYEEVVQGNGENKNVKKHYRNPLYEIYDEYIPDLKPFKDALQLDAKAYEAVQTLEDLRKAIIASSIEIDWSAPNIEKCANKDEIKATIMMHRSPFYQLLVHPKVAECAASILNGAKDTRASIIQSVQTALSLYQDPLIKKNTATSDFCFKDLVDPKQAVSLYFKLQPNDIPKLRPLTRLFVNTMLAKTVRDMKFDTTGANDIKRQRLLLLLDEFPQLKKMDTIENTLAICRSYRVKIFLVAQSTTQLNEIYTRNNSILDNCQVQIYFPPAKHEAAKELSDLLGEKTIESTSHSSNGKITGGSSSVAPMARQLMKPDEIMRMSKNKELVIIPGCRPILGLKIHWFKEEFFKNRVKPPQLFSDTCTEVKNYEELFAIHAADIADTCQKQAEVNEAREKARAAIDCSATSSNNDEGTADINLSLLEREHHEIEVAKSTEKTTEITEGGCVAAKTGLATSDGNKSIVPQRTWDEGTEKIAQAPKSALEAKELLTDFVASDEPMNPEIQAWKKRNKEEI